MRPGWLENVDAEFGERLSSGRLAHALLLTGPAGTAKRQLARSWVKSLLCLERTHPACGCCRSCQLLESGAHPDYRPVGIEMNPKTEKMRTEIVIDQVRSLISFLQLTTTVSERKAAFIDPAEKMNTNAANALLKTLEEPPGNAVLLLVSDDPGRLPTTIRSRCQALVVRQPAPDQSLQWLTRSRGFSSADAELALQATAGSPLLAERMLNDEAVDLYRTLVNVLRETRQGAEGRATARLSDIEPDRLWLWLSLESARAMRANLPDQGRAKALNRLQQRADRNRYLMATTVRKDFLLQDWLIQWAEVNV